MNSNKILRGLVLASLAIGMWLTTSGCTTLKLPAPGIFNGLGGAPMSMLVFQKTGNEPYTREEYAAVVAFAKKSKIRLDYQLSSALEATATSGLAYGAAGAAGGATQGLFYSGALVGAAAGYTGVVYGLGGAVNGMVTASYAEDFALAQMVENEIRDAVLYDGRFELARIHAIAAFIRSKNTEDHAAPELERHNWTGPPVGKARRDD